MLSLIGLAAFGAYSSGAMLKPEQSVEVTVSLLSSLVNLIVAIATFTAAYIAAKGLKTWRQSLFHGSWYNQLLEVQEAQEAFGKAVLKYSEAEECAGGVLADLKRQLLQSADQASEYLRYRILSFETKDPKTYRRLSQGYNELNNRWINYRNLGKKYPELYMSAYPADVKRMEELYEFAYLDWLRHTILFRETLTDLFQDFAI